MGKHGSLARCFQPLPPGACTLEAVHRHCDPGSGCRRSFALSVTGTV